MGCRAVGWLEGCWICPCCSYCDDDEMIKLDSPWPSSCYDGERPALRQARRCCSQTPLLLSVVQETVEVTSLLET
jgi:hypothetical protein